jgi:hypothetical protein
MWMANTGFQWLFENNIHLQSQTNGSAFCFNKVIWFSSCLFNLIFHLRAKDKHSTPIVHLKYLLARSDNNTF